MTTPDLSLDERRAAVRDQITRLLSTEKDMIARKHFADSERRFWMGLLSAVAEVALPATVGGRIAAILIRRIGRRAAP